MIVYWVFRQNLFLKFFNEGSIDITGVVNGIDVEAESRLFHFNEYVTISTMLPILLKYPTALF
jgi:hypothetical protein